MVRKELFGTLEKYVLSGSGDLEAEIITYGAAIRSLRFRGVDVALGYAEPEDYLTIPGYMGTVVGRYANRIAGGKICLNGRTYQLTVNETARGNHLHGGAVGANKRIWEAEPYRDCGVKLTLAFADGEEGYPGAMTLSVIYEVEGDTLRLTYEAKAKGDTVLNPTNHCFFNLNGYDGANVNNHVLTLNASAYTPVNENLIPSGEIRSVAGTPFDFTRGRVIGEEIENRHPDLVPFQGYDHNFVLDGEGFRHGATVRSPDTGIQMDCYTDCPGMQLCGGNYLNAPKGKGGPMGQYQGLCLETQNFPDAPNHPEFPSALLRAGEVFTSVTEYRFSKN